ncbi:hypothetical protein [Legionella antarctica]|nr:hypothetical protein [Legionella antarctica]
MDLNQTNLTLLPYEQNIVIKDITQKISIIELMGQLLKKLQLTLSCFEKKELYRFDAQVGETLCQIRAYKIYCLASHSTPQFLETIGKLKSDVSHGIKKLSIQAEHYQNLLKSHKSQRPESVRAPITLADFFSELDCIIPLSDDALFLFISHFLCHYHLVDDDNIPMAIDFPALSSELSVSRSFAKKIGHFYQKRLSELSCDFIFQLVKELPNSHELESILPLLHHQSDEGRMVLPCYCVTEIIVLHMIEKEANLVLLVNVATKNTRKQSALFLRGSKQQQNFELINEEQQNDQPCMVMYGSSMPLATYLIEHTLKKIISMGIKEVILSNNAAHPQYSGITLSAYRDNPYATLISQQRDSLTIHEISIAQQRASLLIRMKQLADKTGCTSNNPTLFILKHIFCNTVNAYKKSVSIKLFNTTAYTTPDMPPMAFQTQYELIY